MQTTLPLAYVNNYLMNQALEKFHIPTGPEDWGANNTVGCQVKTRDGSGLNICFGVYCGLVNGKPVVAKFEGVSWSITDPCLQYDTVEEMKEIWELD